MDLNKPNKNTNNNKVQDNQKSEDATINTSSDKDNNACKRPLNKEEQLLRKGRKSLVTGSKGKAKTKLRYIEGTTPLKDNCWLTD